MNILNKEILIITFLLIFVLSNCSDPPEKQLSVESKYQVYCGTCHLAPDPANIPKAIWKDRVLPEMAARLGYRYNEYNPFAKNSMEENLYIRMSKTYPEEATIDSVTWQQIHDYVIAHAPDSIPNDILRSERNSVLTQFKPIPISLDKIEIARVTSVQFDSGSNQFLIGDAYGAGYKWPTSSDSRLQFNSPLISYRRKGDDLYFTEIGHMHPSEIPSGVLYRKRSELTDTLASKLHRPVYTEIVDLNSDGQNEILICEFGNLTGELSMLVQSGSLFEKRSLLPVPGTIKLEIEDMDKDGRKDIVVLASQGNEGIYILYQRDDLQFIPDQVIRMGPEYGSSWFELIDYNGDDFPDIVLANGDNADYSIFLKPYHGVRVFINDGKNNFEQKWFYPIYGATRVLAEDYDLDGDLDFAVMASFPDFGNSPDESFVLLENQDPERYLFRSYTLQQPASGRWLVMDKGDVDQDGDADLMLGSFILPPGKDYGALLEQWREQKVDVLFLENRVHR